MKICFLGYSEPDGKVFANGVMRVVYNMAQLFRARGYEVCFYHLFTRAEYKGVNQFLRDNQVDMAIWHMSSLKFKGQLNTPCPLICLWHNSPFFDSKNNSSKTYAVFHRVYNALAFVYLTWRANKLVLLSEGFKKGMLAAKLFPNKITAIPNMNFEEKVEVDWDKKEKRVVYVGRLRGEKQVDKLLEIWSMLGNVADGWTLDICGDGPDRRMLERRTEELGLRNENGGLRTVVFHGFVEPKEYLDRASIFCMTSRYEGFPMVLIEAANRGCVPMAFESFAAVKDIITDGVNGVLVKPFDCVEYAQKLAELMSDTDKRQRMALQTLEDVMRFEPERIMDEWENLIKTVK